MPVAAQAQNSRLGPGAVLVLVVLSIAVVWGVLIRRQTDAKFVAWVLKDAPSITERRKRKTRQGKKFKYNKQFKFA